MWVSGAVDVLRDPGVCGECVCTVEESDNCMTEGVTYIIHTDKNICNLYIIPLFNFQICVHLLVSF